MVGRNYFFVTSAVSSTIILISSIFLARIYSPLEFGDYYEILFTASFLSIFFSLNTDTLIPYVVHKKILFTLLVGISVLLVALSLILIMFFPFYKVGLGILLSSSIIYNKSSMIFIISKRDYNLPGNLKVKMSIIQVAIKYFGKISTGFSALIFGDLIQNIFLFKETSSNIYSFHKLKKKIFLFVNRNKILLSKHIKYGIPQNLIDNVFEYLTPLSISILFDEYTLGLIMFLASKANGILQIVSVNLSQYLGSEYIHYNRSDCTKTFYKAILLWITTGLFTFMLLVYFGERIVIFLFTDKWVESFVFLLPYFPFVILRHVSASFGFLPILKKLQNKSIIFSLSRAIPCVTLIFVQFNFSLLSSYQFWIAYILIGSFVSIGQIVWYNFILRNE